MIHAAGVRSDRKFANFIKDLAASGFSLTSLTQLRPVHAVDVVRGLRNVPEGARFLLLLGIDEFNQVRVGHRMIRTSVPK